MQVDNFTKNLKALRESRGWTQEKLGKEIGSSQNTIALWENGSRKPRYNMVVKLCDALNCTQTDLLGFSDGAAARSYTTYEVINMSDTKSDNPKDANEHNQYPVDKGIVAKYPNGTYQEITSKINHSEITTGSHAYFTTEKDIKNYSDHICLLRIDNNLLCSRIHIFDNTIVLLKRDSKDVYDLDKVEIIGRCVWFEHFERGL